MKHISFAKIAAVGLASLVLLAACGQSSTDISDQPITVVSREEGSGTRGAFIELFGVETKDANGEKLITQQIKLL